MLTYFKSDYKLSCSILLINEGSTISTYSSSSCCRLPPLPPSFRPLSLIAQSCRSFAAACTSAMHSPLEAVSQAKSACVRELASSYTTYKGTAAALFEANQQIIVSLASDLTDDYCM